MAKLNTDKIPNSIARSAIEAWQNGDAKAWRSHFTADVRLLDDGSPRDFNSFSTSAIGNERFTSIDKVENDGKDIYGAFHTKSWGDFKTYFKFHINPEGKIYQLEIGQADY